jgi:hypothetical protein
MIILSLIHISSSKKGDKLSPDENPYKEDKAVKHSLYMEKDSIDRMSIEPVGVPRPKVTQ